VRSSLFLHVLPIVVALVAWAHHPVAPAWRIILVDSLEAGLAGEVLPVFQAELERQLGESGRRVVIDRVELSPAGGARDLRDRLAGVDLVVSFGAAAALQSRKAAQRARVQHLLAFLPTGLASSLAGRSAGALEPPLVVGGEASSQTIAYSIARRLLASRSGPPLRVGVLYRTATAGAGPAAPSFLDADAFVPLPLELPADAGSRATAERIVAAAVAAAAQRAAVDAFWLALDASLTTADVVADIIARTGMPVLHASGRAAVAAGALLSVTAEPTDLAREAAALAGRLLAGDAGAAGTLRERRRLGLALNLTTAATLGIVPPHDLLELSRGRLYR